jgi:multicomponent Na+:H+ antiporter subunit E
VSQPIESGIDTPPADAGDPLAARIGRRWPTLVALIVMWIALWGDLSLANVLGGAAVAVVVMAFADRVQPRPTQHFNLAAALRYLATFARQLLVANWEVALAVLRPDDIRPGILAMPLYGASDAVVTLVANSITLTPGTLTLETERRGDVAILYVHALDLSDADGVREDICELEVLAVEAFAGPDAQAVQARTLADLEERGGADAIDVADADPEAADAGASDRSATATEHGPDTGIETDIDTDDNTDEGSGRQ